MTLKDIGSALYPYMIVGEFHQRAGSFGRVIEKERVQKTLFALAEAGYVIFDKKVVKVASRIEIVFIRIV